MTCVKAALPGHTLLSFAAAWTSTMMRGAAHISPGCPLKLLLLRVLQPKVEAYAGPTKGGRNSFLPPHAEIDWIRQLKWVSEAGNSLERIFRSRGRKPVTCKSDAESLSYTIHKN